MNILDKRFKYVPAAKTDIAKTFKRILAEKKAKEAQQAANAAEAQAVVATFPVRRKGAA